VTDLASAPARSAPGVPPSPPARRLARRGWRDTRLIVGILLVLVSVVVGARVFTSVDRTQDWIAARRDLPAGHVITRGDLTTVPAHLTSGTAGRYYPGGRSNDLVGGTLGRSVSAGDLLAGGDFLASKASPSRVVPVIVKAGRAPALSVGDHVDVFVQSHAAAGANGATGSSAAAEVLVVHDVEYLGEDGLSNGDRSLSLRVPVADAIATVAASQTERVDVVLLEGGAPGGGASDVGPTQAPGYGGS
jgi:hypothetical protein